MSATGRGWMRVAFVVAFVVAVLASAACSGASIQHAPVAAPLAETAASAASVATPANAPPAVFRAFTASFGVVVATANPSIRRVQPQSPCEREIAPLPRCAAPPEPTALRELCDLGPLRDARVFTVLGEDHWRCVVRTARDTVLRPLEAPDGVAVEVVVGSSCPRLLPVLALKGEHGDAYFTAARPASEGGVARAARALVSPVLRRPDPGAREERHEAWSVSHAGPYSLIEVTFTFARLQTNPPSYAYGDDERTPRPPVRLAWLVRDGAIVRSFDDGNDALPFGTVHVDGRRFVVVGSQLLDAEVVPAPFGP